MDTCQDHYSVSIFKNLNPNFWNKQISWQGKKFLGIVVLDAWHLAQYAVFSLLFAAICIGGVQWYNFLIYWAIYFIVFETFYSHILKSS